MENYEKRRKYRGLISYTYKQLEPVMGSSGKRFMSSAKTTEIVNYYIAFKATFGQSGSSCFKLTTKAHVHYTGPSKEGVVRDATPKPVML